MLVKRAFAHTCLEQKTLQPCTACSQTVSQPKRLFLHVTVHLNSAALAHRCLSDTREAMRGGAVAMVGCSVSRVFVSGFTWLVRGQ